MSNTRLKYIWPCLLRNNSVFWNGSIRNCSVNGGGGRGPCIVCGECEGSEKDHLPPKVLFPENLRSQKTEFLTFPVCSYCNRTSSDQDFLFSVLLSIGLNQESIRKESMKHKYAICYIATPKRSSTQRVKRQGCQVYRACCPNDSCNDYTFEL